jgi:hypothetical protein
MRATTATRSAATSREARFVTHDHHVGYVACPASGTMAAGGAFYARCPVCGATLALRANGALPRHKAAAHG